MAQKETESQNDINDFSDLTVKEVLNVDSKSKTIFFEGKFKSKPGKAVVIWEKTGFDESQLPDICAKSSLKREFVNDLYGSYFCFPEPALNPVKTTLVYPATDQHIDRYRKTYLHLVEETPEKYKDITLPCLTLNEFNNEWVYNILDHKKETERIVFEDADPSSGFILLPDLKWNNGNKDNLYMLAICHLRNIKSLRDLNETHIPLLKNILYKGQSAIWEKYNLPASQLRIYFHYQPTFYHLHAHFVNINHEAPGLFAEKAHLIQTVINNLELVGNYYQKASLTFGLRESNFLFPAYEQAGIISRVQPKSKNGESNEDNN